MGWNDVFYIADIRDMFGDSAVARSHTEDTAYSVMVKPTGDYMDYAKHYQLNTCTSYDSCLRFISKLVSKYWNTDSFYNVYGCMYDGFRVTSTVELQRREAYYEQYAEEIALCADDIAEAVNDGLNTRVIEGGNITVVVTGMKSGKRKVTVNGSEGWKQYFNSLVDTIYKFNGHTKQELYKSLDFAIADIYTMNLLFAALKQNGVKSISKLKSLKKSDLFLYLASFVNELETDGE